MTIPIFMTTDDQYIFQACVAIHSMCINTSKDNMLWIVMLCDPSLKEKSRNRLNELCRRFSNLTIRFHEIDPERFIYATSDYYVPIVSFYRLICADVIPDDRAIFLDSDTVVNLDISDFFNEDVSDYYLAGVRDLYPIHKPNFAKQYANEYNLEDFSDYINCGVLLMNLKKIREDGLVERFIEGTKQKNKFVDQDILNRTCHGSIKLLDWRYNMAPRNTEDEYEILCGPGKEYGNVEIIHYCGPSKPWNDRNCPRGDEWWRAAKEALSEREYDRILLARDFCEGRMQVVELADECCNRHCPVIIVGYSDHGQFIRLSLRKLGVKAPMVFCDNDEKKRVLHLGDDEVFSLEELAVDHKGDIWINAIQKYRNEIDEQLLRLGIPEENILHYEYSHSN